MGQPWQGGAGGYEPHRPPVNPRPHTRMLADQRGYAPADYRPGGRPPGGGAPPAPPRRRRRWRIRRILAAVLVLLLVGAVVTWFSMDSSLHRVNALSDY